MTPERLPKLYLVRHGETEWTINGRYTGTSDIPLTANGIDTIYRLGKKVTGPCKIIDPNLLSIALVSPRQRAQKTFQLLFAESAVKPSFQTDDRVREWTYGDYEGLFTHQIVEMHRKTVANGNGEWDIWVDGCQGGENVDEMTERVDEVVKAIKKLHTDWVSDPLRKEDDQGGDVLIVSHGHFSRCLLARWLGLPLANGQLFSLDPGGICVLQYYHELGRTCVGAINLGML